MPPCSQTHSFLSLAAAAGSGVPSSEAAAPGGTGWALRPFGRESRVL